MKNTIICLVILGIPILLWFVSGAIQDWHYVFDDAFITYRYAKNLAMGHGITWNPGHPPTEGYTNFLLVVFLAPFIKAGLDPLLVTRILSYLSIVAMTWILFVVAKRQYSCTTTTGIMIAALILLVPQTRNLCLVGLETIIYALFLLIAFLMGIRFLDSRRTFHSVSFSVLVILTMLLRPEAALIYPIVLVLYFTHRGAGQAIEIKPMILGLGILLALGGTYMAWKALHFGHLLPNPFYIKVSDNAFISSLGAESVKTFITRNAILLALAYASLMYSFSATTYHRQKTRISILLGLSFITVYACFFVRTDTLMDINGRFMYPLLPILICLTIPALSAALTALESRVGNKGALSFSGMVVAFMFAFTPNGIINSFEDIKNLTPNNKWKTSDELMQKEFRIALQLSTFPGIENLRIAFSDSGVIPYYTGSIWLDVTGLNDSTIARTRNREQLLNYFFGFQADLVIHPSNKGFNWISWDHGPLGDYTSWSNDPRWDEYLYVGTSKTYEPMYDLQYFVRKSSPYYKSLKDFLETKIVDGWYKPLPYNIGTWIFDRKMQPAWIPRSEPRA